MYIREVEVHSKVDFRVRVAASFEEFVNADGLTNWVGFGVSEVGSLWWLAKVIAKEVISTQIRTIVISYKFPRTSFLPYFLYIKFIYFP